MFYIVGCSLFKPQLLPLAPGKNSLLRTGRSTICGALPKPQAHSTYGGEMPSSDFTIH